MNVLLLEPFFGGSHKQWAQGLQKHSKYQIDILGLSGAHWKWRMHGGAITLARKFLDGDYHPDVILASDMLDLTTFLALTREKTASVPCGIYFHENQLTYPWSPQDRDKNKQRDHHYSFINFSSAIAADRLYFNSEYHRSSFLESLPRFLSAFPDHKELDQVKQLEEKSQVLSLGLDLARFDAVDKKDAIPERAVLLWNHRWEYDKNPEAFYEAISELADRGVEFKLIILGERFERYPAVFDKLEKEFRDRILHIGYASSFEEYAQWVKLADILPVTSDQDFFGGSVVEAMYCDVVPLLPKRLAYPGAHSRGISREFFLRRSPRFRQPVTAVNF